MTILKIGTVGFDQQGDLTFSGWHIKDAISEREFQIAAINICVKNPITRMTMLNML